MYFSRVVFNNAVMDDDYFTSRISQRMHVSFAGYIMCLPKGVADTYRTYKADGIGKCGDFTVFFKNLQTSMEMVAILNES